MTASKSPQAALDEIRALKNVVFILVMAGFVVYSVASLALGFDFTDALWLSSLLAAAGWWYACERFSTNPGHGLLATIWIVLVLCVVLWVGAAVATVTYWGELDWATMLGILLGLALTFLGVRIAMLGGTVLLGPVPSHAAGPPSYGPPVEPVGPPASSPRAQPEAPPAYPPSGQPAAAGSGPVCPSCGRPSAPGTKFCPHDGTPIPQGCPSCGYVSPPGTKFCAMCGSALSGA